MTADTTGTMTIAISIAVVDGAFPLIFLIWGFGNHLLFQPHNLGTKSVNPLFSTIMMKQLQIL